MAAGILCHAANLGWEGLPKPARLSLPIRQSLVVTGRGRRETSSCPNNVVEDRNNSPAVHEDLKSKELVVGRIVHRILEPVNHVRTRVYQLRCHLPGQLFLIT